MKQPEGRQMMGELEKLNRRLTKMSRGIGDLRRTTVKRYCTSCDRDVSLVSQLHRCLGQKHHVLEGRAAVRYSACQKFLRLMAQFQEVA